MAFAFLTCVAYATIVLRGPQGLTALNEKRALARALEAQNADLRHEVEAKSKRVEKLQNDPETEIRRRLGVQKVDETTFKPVTPTPTAQ